METMISKLTEYGVLALIVAILFYILWQIISWAKTFISKQSEQFNVVLIELHKQQTTERNCWLEGLAKHNELITKISTSIEEHDRRADERGRYVREEHQEMIKSLGRINGYVKE
jgi:hypothetical protein